MVKTAYTCTTNMKSNTMEKKHHELNMVKTAYTCTTNMKSNTMEKKHHEQNMATTGYNCTTNMKKENNGKNNTNMYTMSSLSSAFTLHTINCGQFPQQW